MIKNLRLAVIGDSTDFVELDENENALEIKLDLVIAQMFSDICREINDLPDTELKLSEKFKFALNLKNMRGEETND